MIPPSERFDARASSKSLTMVELKDLAQKMARNNKVQNITHLEGGYSNENYLIETAKTKFVLRIYLGNQNIAEREAGILELLAKKNIPAPKLIDLVKEGEKAVAFLSFVKGNHLAIESSGEVYRQIGENLAKIHQITFNQAGLIGKNAVVLPGCQHFGQFIRGLIHQSLDHHAGRRLGTRLTAEVRKFLDEHWTLVEETYDGPVLAHCDFNSKNILVHGSQVHFLDWEFALSGHKLFDFGNFFRFENDHKQENLGLFLSGYENAGGKLPPHWLRAAKILDLANMCEFLDRPKDHPKTFHTAKSIISRTLALKF